MDQDGGSSKAHHKEVHGRGELIKFRGVTRHSSGKYSGQIRDPNKRCTVYLGMFATAVEAARAFDRAAFHFRGEKAVLNFPAEYAPTLSASSASTMAATSSSSSMATGEVFESESEEWKWLEDLLDPNNVENKK